MMPNRLKDKFIVEFQLAEPQKHEWCRDYSWLSKITLADALDRFKEYADVELKLHEEWTAVRLSYSTRDVVAVITQEDIKTSAEFDPDYCDHCGAWLDNNCKGYVPDGIEPWKPLARMVWDRNTQDGDDTELSATRREAD
jgi:hypothetical protein